MMGLFQFKAAKVVAVLAALTLTGFTANEFVQPQAESGPLIRLVRKMRANRATRVQARVARRAERWGDPNAAAYAHAAGYSSAACADCGQVHSSGYVTYAEAPYASGSSGTAAYQTYSGEYTTYASGSSGSTAAQTYSTPATYSGSAGSYAAGSSGSTAYQAAGSAGSTAYGSGGPITPEGQQYEAVPTDPNSPAAQAAQAAPAASQPVAEVQTPPAAATPVATPPAAQQAPVQTTQPAVAVQAPQPTRVVYVQVPPRTIFQYAPVRHSVGNRRGCYRCAECGGIHCN